MPTAVVFGSGAIYVMIRSDKYPQKHSFIAKLEFANLKREVELTSFKEQLAKAKLRTFRAERKSSNWRKTWMRDNQIRNNVKIKTEIIDDNCIIIELFYSSIFLTFEYLLFVHIFCYKLIYI